jgi:hypothetical protein
MRYELNDPEWIAFKPMLPDKLRGVPRVNDRRVLNGIFWVLRSGAPWRDLPQSFGPYTTCYNRFFRWPAGSQRPNCRTSTVDPSNLRTYFLARLPPMPKSTAHSAGHLRIDVLDVNLIDARSQADRPGIKIARPIRIQRGRNSMLPRRFGRLIRSSCLSIAAAFLITDITCAETIRIVAIGASNAAGTAVGVSAAWPAQLGNMLRGKGYDVNVSVAATAGAGSAQILQQAGSIPSGTRVVVFDIGAGNDRDQGVSAGSATANRAEIEARIRASGAKPVFVSYKSIVGPEGSSAWIAGDRHHHFTAQSHQRVAAAILPRVIAAIGKK